MFFIILFLCLIAGGAGFLVMYVINYIKKRKEVNRELGNVISKDLKEN